MRKAVELMSVIGVVPIIQKEIMEQRTPNNAPSVKSNSVFFFQLNGSGIGAPCHRHHMAQRIGFAMLRILFHFLHRFGR